MAFGKSYPHRLIIGLGITQLVISGLIIIFGIVTSLYIGFKYGSAPIVIGICFALAGILAVLLSKYRKDGLVIAVVTVSVLSSLFAAGLFIGLAVLMAQFASVYNSFDCGTVCQITKGPVYGILGVMIFLLLVEFVVAIVTASTSGGCCFQDNQGTHDKVRGDCDEK
uniref:Uncharacterized protein LOC102806516 n=1 Tax=Saccoglossus kowalevskii TaxID=10224 RepID=A0ABM0N068_SACKO|nr:PREDICTED: uncharacterized protein LOC102806516 [Saccoglossus kowalevskii]